MAERTSGSRTSSSCDRPGSTSCPSASSPGRGSSRAEGRFEFGWLDRVVDLLHGAGIGVNLATPTASPPPWLVRAAPGDPARDRRRRHAVARLAAPLLPAQRRLPRAGRGSSRAHSPSTIGITRRWRSGTSTTSTPATSASASATPRRRRSATGSGTRYGTIDAPQRGMGDDLLEPDLRRLARRSSRRAARRRSSTRASSSTGGGSPPTPGSPASRISEPSVAGITPGVPVTTNFMGFLQADRLLDVGGARGRRLERQLPEHGRPELDDRGGDDRATSCGRWARVGPWMLMEQATGPRQLAAAQRHETARGSCGSAASRRSPGGPRRSCSSSGARREPAAEKFHSAMLPHGGTGENRGAR